MEVAKLRCGLHLRRDVARLEPINLVDGNHHRHAELEDPLGDEAVAGADPVPRIEDEEHCVDVLEGGVDGPLHVLRQGVARSLEPGEICEHELGIGPVGHAEDPPARRLGLI